MPSKLEQLQLQFRQKLMQEKEERMIKIHTDSQQKALNKVTRYDSNHQLPATTVTKKSPTISPNQSHHSPVKKGSPGVDRSRPLPPIPKEQKNYANRTGLSNVPSENYSKTIASSSVRSKSVELEIKQSPLKTTVNGKVKQKTELSRQPEIETRSAPYQQAQIERKSPEIDYLTKLKQAELQRLRMNSKVNSETTPKPSNGYVSSQYAKSSNEQKPALCNNKPHIMGTAARAKPRAQATTVSRKPISTVAKPRNAPRNDSSVRKPPNANQDQCRYCGRNFNKDRIEKHVAICSKTSTKKVKVFDVTKMRVQGTEAENYVRKGPVAQPPKPKKTNWKKQHEEFISAIRQAKVMQRHLAAGGKVSDLPPPPPSDTSHYVPCPHCGRKFNEGVAERHIPKCKNIVCNKKTFKKK